MALLYLIRHAACDSVGRWVANRVPGPGLNAEGEAQARALADRLSGTPLDAVYSSPFERARRTAAPLASSHGLEVRVLDGLGEVRFGAWAERPFEELDRLPEWKAFNALRSFLRPPGGESAAEVRARSLGEIERLAAAHPEGTAALVSHGDVIKSVVMWALGIPVDFLHRIDIAPASVSILELRPWGVRVRRVNDSGPIGPKEAR